MTFFGTIELDTVFCFIWKGVDMCMWDTVFIAAPTVIPFIPSLMLRVKEGFKLRVKQILFALSFHDSEIGKKRWVNRLYARIYS